MITLNPYLGYNGNCEEAFLFYKRVFRAADLHITRYKDAPEEARAFFRNASAENVMHATLKIDEHTEIMGNDHAEALLQSEKPPSRDFCLYVHIDNPKEAIRIFEELSAGGKVILPVTPTFWTPVYGVLTDRFGMHWKITSHQSKEEED